MAIAQFKVLASGNVPGRVTAPDFEFQTIRHSEGAGPGSSAAAARRNHRKSSSLTFAKVEGRRNQVAFAEREEKEKADAAAEAEAADNRRRQRRRSEAKAALEVSCLPRWSDTNAHDSGSWARSRLLTGGLPRMMTTRKTARWTTCHRA